MQRVLLVLCLTLSSLLFNHAVMAEQRVYTFGIVPQQSPSKLASLWGPLLKNVGDAAGIRLQFATAPSIPVFEQRLANGEYDFAYMNPYHFTVFQSANGYKAVAKARDKRLKGIMVVRKGGAVKTLSDLQGKELAFPAPAAFAATILTQSHLNTLNIDFTPKYVSSHDSVYRTVAQGLYAAGGGIERTLNNLAPEIRDQLEVLWVSEGYTPHAIAAHPRVDSAVTQQLQQALILMEQSEAGIQLLQGIRIKGWEAANDQDWDDVSGLQLQKLSY